MDRERQDVLKLGGALAEAEGYRVIALDGRDVGEVEHVRYERHADHPDEIIIFRRVLFWRRRGTIPFDVVGNVDRRRGRVYLTIPSEAIDHLAD